MGGAICALLFGFGGLQFQEEQLIVEPTLPPGWRRQVLRPGGVVRGPLQPPWQE